MKQSVCHKYLALILPLLFILSFPFIFNSCIGVGMDITLNKDGSGTITLEYIIRQSFDSLGKLDGNERWNTIPVGRADFMRTIDRIPEMKLLSFSSKENAENIIVNAKMEFDNLRALTAFLDMSGRRSSYSGDANSGSLVLTLTEGLNTDQGNWNNENLIDLIAVISEQYQVKMSMSFPNEGSLKITDAQGLLSELPGSEIKQMGKNVSFTLPLYTVLSSTGGINVEFMW